MKAEALCVLCNPADLVTPTVLGVQMAESLSSQQGKFGASQGCGLSLLCLLYVSAGNCKDFYCLSF